MAAKRLLLATWLAAAFEAFFVSATPGQVYPSRPITMIVPVPAGGSLDAAGRVVAERMRGSLGQAIVIENVSGADGTIGIGRLARARPDGYTIGIGTLATHVVNGVLYSLQYDLLNGFAPISLLGSNSFILLAKQTMPAKDLNELIAWLKYNPDTASAAIGIASVHILTALFQRETGTRFALVPYRGSAPAMQDLVAGHIELVFDTLLQLSLVRARSIRAYAVASDRRLTLAPDIPTFAELGLPAVSFSGWIALFAPRGTPKEVIGMLNSAVVKALADQTTRLRLADLGYDTFPRERQSPEALGAILKADSEKWGPIIRQLGIKAGPQNTP